jgi:hypothetical protein
MYWQTMHRKPRVGGYLARLPWSTYNWFHRTPIISDILLMTHRGAGKWTGKAYSPDAIQRFIKTFDLGYVIIPPSERRQYYTEVMDGLLAGRIAQILEVEGYRLYVLY